MIEIGTRFIQYSSAGTYSFRVPDGVTKLLCTLVGGGGGGGAYYQTANLNVFSSASQDGGDTIVGSLTSGGGKRSLDVNSSPSSAGGANGTRPFGLSFENSNADSGSGSGSGGGSSCSYGVGGAGISGSSSPGQNATGNGGGGGGGFVSGKGSAPGGAGSGAIVREQEVSVTPGSIISITVGVGGNGGIATGGSSITRANGGKGSPGLVILRW